MSGKETPEEHLPGDDFGFYPDFDISSSDEDILFSYRDKGNGYWGSKEYKSAVEEYQLGVIAAATFTNHNAHSYFLNNLALATEYLGYTEYENAKPSSEAIGDMNEAWWNTIRLHYEALEISHRSGYTEGCEISLLNIADFWSRTGDYEKGIEAIKGALKLAEINQSKYQNKVRNSHYQGMLEYMEQNLEDLGNIQRTPPGISTDLRFLKE